MNLWNLCEDNNDASSRRFGPAISRRSVLSATLASALTAWLGRSALAQAHIEPTSGENHVLVTLFLRGAMDGLSMVVPYGDDDYHRLRPTIGLGKPGGAGRVQKLDDFYGLHPVLSPLVPLYEGGQMAALHAVGSMDQSRSHFEAMAIMERGASDDPATLSSGWVARFLDNLPESTPSPLRAVSFGGLMPDILRGAANASALSSLDELRLQLPKGATKGLDSSLAALYAGGDDAISVAGRETFSVLKTIERLDPKNYKPENGAQYPESRLGDGFKQTALLVKAGIGLRAACLDRGGWDTHVTQGAAIGYLSLQFDDVAKSLAAFVKDLGAGMDRVTVVVMTEFGRRAAENFSLGTDHGRASSWLLLGGGVSGGKVYGNWPTLRPEKLEGPGDLRVTTDYRDVLSEVAASRFGLTSAAIAKIFPGAPGKFPGIVGGAPTRATNPPVTISRS